MEYNFYKSHAWKSDPDDLFMENVLAFRKIVQLYDYGTEFTSPTTAKHRGMCRQRSAVKRSTSGLTR